MTRRRHRWRRMLFLALMLLPVLALAGAEIYAWVRFPHAGKNYFSSVPTTGGRLVTFAYGDNRPQFSDPKPADVFRIFFFGESVCAGSPFVPGAAFPYWLAVIANATRPGEAKVESVDLARSGATMDATVDYVKASLRYQPDLIVIYAGVMENGSWQVDPANPNLAAAWAFLLRHSRLISGLEFWAQGRAFLWRLRYLESRGLSIDDRSLVPDSFAAIRARERVERLYRHNLSAMISAARAQGVPVVVIPPAVNLRDWPPSISLHRPGLFRDAAESETQTTKGRMEGENEEWETAADTLVDALQNDHGYAETHFILARTLDQLGEPEAAFQHYQMAREYDGLLLRPPPTLLDIANELSPGRVVDLDPLIEAATSINPGPPVFADAVHTTMYGNYLLARLVLAEFDRMGVLPAGNLPPPGYAEARASIALPAKTEAAGFAYIAIGLVGLFDKPARAAAAQKLFLEAERLNPDDAFFPVARAAAAAKLGDWPTAGEALGRALALDPRAPEKISAHYFPGLIEISPLQVVIGDPEGFNWLRTARLRMRGEGEGGPEPDGPAWTIPLRRMSRAWLRRPEGLREAELNCLWSETSAAGPRPSLDLFAILRSVEFHGLTHRVGKTFTATEADNFFVFHKLPDPLGLELEIRARVTGRLSSENWADLYWTAGDNQFSEAKKVSFPLPANGDWQTVTVPLHSLLPLLFDRPLGAIRLDLLNGRGEIEVGHILIRPPAGGGGGLFSGR